MNKRRIAGLRKITCVYLITISLLAVFLTEVPNEASAQVTEEWVARYDGPMNDYDSGSSIGIDSEGNVYITGESWGNGTITDIVTIKYDSYGNELWVARYDGTGGYDRPRAMAIDSSGNVYITGRSWGVSSSDYLTIKYDTNGNELWVARFNGPKNADDRAEDIVVDESSGNIYVTGRYDFDISTFSMPKYATVAYDSSGSQLWVAEYIGPGNSPSGANAIALDSAGNIYVTGTNYYDAATIKYDSLGNELWVAVYNGPANTIDTARDITVGSNGDIYIIGHCDGGPSLPNNIGDLLTVAYDSSGNELWAARYNGPGNGHDWGHEIVTDSSGNVYSTGWSEGSGTGQDFTTIQYDSSGNELWVKRYNGPGNGDDIAYGIAVDSMGNIYITGRSEGNGTGSDYTTIAYDSSGYELWAARYNGWGDKSDRPYDIVADNMDNVYVTGNSHYSYDYNDMVTIKYFHRPPNEPPVAEALGPYFYEEGTYAVFISGSYDPEGAPLEYRWDLNNDGTWDTDWSDIPFIIRQIGDDFKGEIVLQVGDGRAQGIDIAIVTITNVTPSIKTDVSFPTDIELGLRVAGRKYNDIGMTVYEDGNPASFISVERTPGSPDDHMVWMPMSLDSSKTYTANVTFTPEDPPNVGANPVWIYIKHANGTIENIHHTFNVEQSKNKNSKHGNHMEPWEVELNEFLNGGQIEVTTYVTDPGSDDIFITYTYGSQVVNVSYLNEPPNPDPYHSLDVNPRDIIDIQTLNYEGPGILTVTAEDDDGGITTQTLSIL